jgi:hypothetical protein
VFTVLLCYAMAGRVAGKYPRRFKTVAWLLVLAAVGLLVRFGADVGGLETPVSVAAVLANLWLIWLMFTAPQKGQTTQVT